MKSLLKICLLFCAVIGYANSASASIMEFTTPIGATISSLPVSAKVTFTTSADLITIVLENLQADAKSVAQCISGLSFTVSTGQSSGTLFSSSGIERWVSSKGAVTNGSAVSTGWSLGSTGGQLQLDVLGTKVGPEHTIIGPPAAGGTYTHANGSIAGNGPHNPFIAQLATFTLNVPGVTAASGIDNVVFSFNTSPGSNVIGSGSGVPVPEPATMSLLVLGGIAVLIRRRRTAA